MRIKTGILAAFLFFTASAMASTSAQTLDEWLVNTRDTSLQLLLKNIHPEGTATGVVVASPSKADPDYFYHWTRDAALVMHVIVDLYARASTPQQRSNYEQLLLEYIDFTRKNQTTLSAGGIGEPKYNVDGSPFTGPWGRPQNDGPALRAVTLIRLAKLWLAEGKEQLVREKLYDSEFPTNSVVKADLEYVSHEWIKKDFDLWEEVRGNHFYTRMAQRRAMIEGAELAALLGDSGASGWYAKQAKLLETELVRHWDNRKGIIQVTLNRDAGADYKWSGLDAAIVLAVLHSSTNDDFFSATDERVLATARKIETTFKELYPMNQKGLPAIAIGRYPEDRYDGKETNTHGNAWVLITAGFGEFYHLSANRFEKAGVITITQPNLDFFEALGVKTLAVGKKIKASDKVFGEILINMRKRGDEFLARVRYHGPDGHFAEQMNRWTGYMQGAKDLTWSYAAFITATDRRARR